jgi:hypothetical protein
VVVFLFFPVTFIEYVPGFVPLGNIALTLPLFKMVTFTFFIALPLASRTLELATLELKLFGNEDVKVVGLLKTFPVAALGDGAGLFEGVGVGVADLVAEGEGEGVGVGVGDPPPPPPPPPPPLGLDGVTTPSIETAVGASDLDPEPIMLTD